MTAYRFHNGAVWQSVDGRWRASGPGLVLGAFPTAEAAVRALERATKTRKQLPKKKKPAEPSFFEPRLTSDGNLLVRDSRGKKIGAVTRSPSGEFIAWALHRKLGTFTTSAEAETAVWRFWRSRILT
jgi:hypothetical protein